MAGAAIGDVWQLPPPTRPYLDEARTAPDALKVAWTTKPVDPDTVVEPAWRDAVTTTVALLDELEGKECIPHASPPERRAAPAPP